MSIKCWLIQTSNLKHANLNKCTLRGLWSKRTHAKTYPTKTYPVLVKTYPLFWSKRTQSTKTYPTFWSKRTQYIFSWYSIYIFTFFVEKSDLHIGLNVPNNYFKVNFWYIVYNLLLGDPKEIPKNIPNMLVETYPKYFVQFNGFECLLHSIKMQLFLSYYDNL